MEPKRLNVTISSKNLAPATAHYLLPTTYLRVMEEIIVVGAGNLAWHLIQILQQAEYDVALASRDPNRVAGWPVRVIGLADIPVEPAMVFIAVPDNAIYTVTAELSLQLPPEVPIIHTSGATPVAKINPYFRQRGALWPIRSLRQGENVTDWRDLPLVFYSDNAALTQVLSELCHQLSDKTYELNDEQRAQLHLAAVFSNNFVTILYQIGYDICKNNSLDFELLSLIVKENRKGFNSTVMPINFLTGPAIRKDYETLNKHINLLSKQDIKDIYEILSKYIIEYPQEQS